MLSKKEMELIVEAFNVVNNRKPSYKVEVKRTPEEFASYIMRLYNDREESFITALRAVLQGGTFYTNSFNENTYHCPEYKWCFKCTIEDAVLAYHDAKASNELSQLLTGYDELSLRIMYHPYIGDIMSGYFMEVEDQNNTGEITGVVPDEWGML